MDGAVRPGLLRPEVADGLLRWREALAGLAIALLGLWWGLASFGVLAWVGWAMALAGAVLIWTGAQRARFRGGAGGPGIVELDERRLTYFGPLSGGSVDLDDLAELDWDPASRPPHWWLTAADGTELAIPSTATGAERLLDAAAALPGLSPSDLVAVQRRRGLARLSVWRRPGRRPDPRPVLPPD